MRTPGAAAPITGTRRARRASADDLELCRLAVRLEPLLSAAEALQCTQRVVAWHDASAPLAGRRALQRGVRAFNGRDEREGASTEVEVALLSPTVARALRRAVASVPYADSFGRQAAAFAWGDALTARVRSPA